MHFGNEILSAVELGELRRQLTSRKWILPENSFMGSAITLASRLSVSKSASRSRCSAMQSVSHSDHFQITDAFRLE